MKKYLPLSTMLASLSGCMTTGVSDTHISLEEDTNLTRTSVSVENTAVYHSKVYNHKTGETRENTIIPAQVITDIDNEQEANIIENIIGHDSDSLERR